VSDKNTEVSALSFEDALAELEQIVRSLESGQQKLEDAIAPLDKAAKLAPGLLAARASLGRALLAADRAADAVPHLRAALPADRDGSLHFQLSRALAAQGKAADAAQFAQKSRQLRKLIGDDGQPGEITPP